MNNVKSRIVLWVLGFTVFHNGFCQITNVFYLPEDHSYNSYWTSAYYIPFDGILTTNFLQKISPEYRRMLTNAVYAGECRPAEFDPEGYWGEVKFGFQLSIRSNTNIFVLGESIPVTTIFRNTTTNKLIVFWDAIQSTSISVRDESGKDVSGIVDISKRPMGGSYALGEMLPERQSKEQFDLKDFLASAKAGIYKVCANRMVVEMPTNWASWKPNPDVKDIQVPPFLPSLKFTNLQSGVLTIKLIDP